jgi:hypothetical protein
MRACRCAWLNHSKDPEQFVELVREFPRVRAWCSGHFHLSQNYADSITSLGSCAFIQTGVIGPKSSRDGDRQSRMLRLSQDGYQVLPCCTGHTTLTASRSYSYLAYRQCNTDSARQLCRLPAGNRGGINSITEHLSVYTLQNSRL